MVFVLSAIVPWLLFVGCVQPHKESLLAREAICEAIGKKGQEQELCVLNNVNHSPYYEISRFFLVSAGRIIELDPLGSGFGIYEMLVSHSKRYLAFVENAGEGHSELSVCSLEGLLQGEEGPCFAGFNPYPGGVYDLKWAGMF